MFRKSEILQPVSFCRSRCYTDWEVPLRHLLSSRQIYGLQDYWKHTNQQLWKNILFLHLAFEENYPVWKGSTVFDIHEGTSWEIHFKKKIKSSCYDNCNSYFWKSYDRWRKENNTSETKLQEYNIFFHLKFRAIGRRAVEIINFL